MKTNVAYRLIPAVGLLLWLVAPAQAQIKIGVAAPLTGNVQWIGEQQEAGAQKAVDHLNDSGGLLGQEVEIISVDDGCNPEQAKAAAEQLVSQGVVFVDGHMCSSASLAVSKIYEEAGIIMITPASTNPRVTDEGGPNVFRVTGRDDQQGAVAGTYLAEHHPENRIGIIHDGQAYGQGLAEHTKSSLNKQGIKELLFDAFEPDQLDYLPFVDKLVEANVEVLYAGGYLADIALILRLARKRLPDLKLLSGDAIASEDWLDLAGEAGSVPCSHSAPTFA
ncbi:MAG: branched-chain amino acid ABC transporter substrate-binding protein [Pseudomonadota bacterium]